MKGAKQSRVGKWDLGFEFWEEQVGRGGGEARSWS